MINKEKIEQMIESLWESDDLDTLDLKVKRICEAFDVEKFSIASYFNNEFQIVDTYPLEWMNHYREHKYYLHDPVTSWGKIRLSFSWQGDKMKNLTPIQKRLFSEAHDFGVKNGTTISLLPFANERAFFTVLNLSKLHPDVMQALSLMGHAYCQTKQRIEKNYSSKVGIVQFSELVRCMGLYRHDR
jgi:hypothetical protein